MPTPTNTPTEREIAEKATKGPWVTEPGLTLTWIGPGKAVGRSPLTGEHKVADVVAVVDGGPESGYFEDSLEQKLANALFIATFNPARVLSLLDDIARMREALEDVVAHCKMSREEFIGQGPAFACRQVERAVAFAEAALKASPQ